jgi:hypothetical protein
MGFFCMVHEFFVIIEMLITVLAISVSRTLNIMLFKTKARAELLVARTTDPARVCRRVLFVLPEGCVVREISLARSTICHYDLRVRGKRFQKIAVGQTAKLEVRN